MAEFTRARTPWIFLIVKIEYTEKINEEFKSDWLSKALLWFTFVFMGALAVQFFLSCSLKIHVD
jgi:hypothetical protein